jgi:hypothetical protein
MTVQARPRADTEAAAGEERPSTGAPAEAEAEISDEKLERHEATLSVDSKERDRTSTDSTDKKSSPHAGA